MDVKPFAENIGKIITKNSPHILTGLGCAGLISTAILTGTAVPKALYILEAEEDYRRLASQKDVDFTFFEKVKLTWKIFIPAGVVGAISIACIIGANTVSSSRNAALAALYSLSETAFREYKINVIEEIGASKERGIRDKIAKNAIIQNPVEGNTIIVTGNGSVLCYDKLSDRYFTSSYETIRQKVNDLNYELRQAMWLDLNELYYSLGLQSTKLGDQLGFDIEKSSIELEYSTQLSPTGQPCLVIDTTVYPKFY